MPNIETKRGGNQVESRLAARLKVEAYLSEVVLTRIEMTLKQLSRFNSSLQDTRRQVFGIKCFPPLATFPISIQSSSSDRQQVDKFCLEIGRERVDVLTNGESWDRSGLSEFQVRCIVGQEENGRCR